MEGRLARMGRGYGTDLGRFVFGFWVLCGAWGSLWVLDGFLMSSWKNYQGGRVMERWWGMKFC